MIKAIHLFKTYPDTGRTALRDVSFTLPNTGLVLLKGESGSGKSTLLSAISTLEEVDKGSITFNDKVITSFSKKEKQEYLKNDIAICFQDKNLVPYLTVEENILPYASNKDYLKTITYLGLTSLLKSKVMTLSGGEQERVSILRATLKKSKVLLLDEPANSLDEDNVDKVFTLLKNISKDKLVIISSHIPLPKSVTPDVTLNMEKGELLSYEVNNKDVFKTETKEEEQDFFPPKKVLITSFFKEVFRSLFHFKTRLITSIVILFLSLVTILSGLSSLFTNENAVIFQGIRSNAGGLSSYVSLGYDISRNSQETYSFLPSDQDYIGFPVYSSRSSIETTNITTRYSRVSDNINLRKLCSSPSGYMKWEDVSSFFPLLFGSSPKNNECLISRFSFSIFEEHGFYSQEMKLAPHSFSEEEFLSFAPTISLSYSLNEFPLTIVGIYDDGLEEFIDKYLSTIDNSPVSNSYSNEVYVGAVLQNIFVNQDTLQALFNYSSLNDFSTPNNELFAIYSFNNHLMNGQLYKVDSSDINLSKEDGIYLSPENFLRVYPSYGNIDFTLPYVDLRSVTKETLFSSLLPFKNQTLNLAELLEEDYKKLACFYYVSNLENNDYLALFAHDMVEKGYITEDYIGNYDLLKTYYALCLSGGTWPFLDSLYENNPYGENGKNIVKTFLSEFLPSLTETLPLTINYTKDLYSSKLTKEFKVIGFSFFLSGNENELMFSNSDDYNYFLNFYYNPKQAYFTVIPLSLYSFSDIIAFKDSLNSSSFCLRGVVANASRTIYGVTHNLLTIIITSVAFAVLLIISVILLLYLYNSINILSIREDSVRLSFGASTFPFFLRNFMTMFLISLMSLVLSIPFSYLVLYLLNSIFSSWVSITSTYVMVEPILFLILLILLIVLSSLISLLVIFKNKKNLNKALKEAFH